MREQNAKKLEIAEKMQPVMQQFSSSQEENSGVNPQVSIGPVFNCRSLDSPELYSADYVVRQSHIVQVSAGTIRGQAYRYL